MKKINLILIVFVIGCTNINYLYKNQSAFSKSDFLNTSTIGIAVWCNSIPDLYSVIVNDTEKFLDDKANFIKVSDIVTLSSDRLMIKNIDDLKSKYPKILYLIAVFQQKPNIERSHGKKLRKETYFSYKDDKFREKEIEYEYFKTKFSIKCEIMLFNISNNTLIAKSIKEISKKTQFNSDDSFKNDTVLGNIEDVFDAFDSIEESNFPNITAIESSKLKNYFYLFLKQI